MHNYEQKVLLIHDSASPLPELKHGAFYNDVPTAQTLSCARGYVKTSSLRGFEDDVGQIRLISQIGYHRDGGRAVPWHRRVGRRLTLC